MGERYFEEVGRQNGERKSKSSNERWEEGRKKRLCQVLALVWGKIRVVEAEIGGVGARMPQQRSGWAGGLLSGVGGRCGAVREPGR